MQSNMGYEYKKCGCANRRLPTLIDITEESLPAHAPLLTGVDVVVTEGRELGISEVGEAQGAQTLRERGRT